MHLCLCFYRRYMWWSPILPIPSWVITTKHPKSVIEATFNNVKTDVQPYTNASCGGLYFIDSVSRCQDFANELHKLAPTLPLTDRHVRYAKNVSEPFGCFIRSHAGSRAVYFNPYGTADPAAPTYERVGCWFQHAPVTTVRSFTSTFVLSFVM